jgi:hypothetical protein
MGNLGSFTRGFLTLLLTTPVRFESSVYDCVAGAACPPSVISCYTVLGWENVLGPLGCSRWAAVGTGLLVGRLVRAAGARRAHAAR